MIRQALSTVAVMVLAIAPAIAQPKVQVIDGIQFKTDVEADGTQSLTFGFGSDYTDSTDFDKGEQILPPFFPPDGFYTYFGIKDATGGEDFGTKDIRGVPDSVKSDTVNYFSQQYIIHIQRYAGQNVSIVYPFPPLRGIDSLVFESTQAGADFHTTFTDRGSVLIPNPNIRTLRMTVYYNYNRAAAVPVTRADAPAQLAIAPNPLRSGSELHLAGAFPAGSRVMVHDQFGSLVSQSDLAEGSDGVRVSMAGLPSGAYNVRVLGQGNEVIGQGRVLLVR
ncbi:MAG: hypothetical protein JST22_02145 [Bacteroidetes bacterium]|nr:hypothetical protein [Bacteroidota bacterium]